MPIRNLLIGAFAICAIAIFQPHPADAACKFSKWQWGPDQTIFKTTPPNAQLDCQGFGIAPLNKIYYVVGFDVTNTAPAKRMVAIKGQVNFLDSFGDIVATWPIIEDAKLGNGDTDHVAYYIRRVIPIDKQAATAEIWITGVKYDDGSIWTNDTMPKTGPTPSSEQEYKRDKT